MIVIAAAGEKPTRKTNVSNSFMFALTVILYDCMLVYLHMQVSWKIGEIRQRHGIIDNPQRGTGDV